MQCTRNLRNIEPGQIESQIIKPGLSLIFSQYPLIIPTYERISQQGGIAYLVGGAVRDLILGLPIHDLDIEVHGLTLEQLASILGEFSVVSYVGKSFGVLKSHGTPIDWALPRTDTSGRKPMVTIDPHMDIREALRRRDVTMNAMAIELATGRFVDPFHGYEDMRNALLRSPDSRFFEEDPLRFYRVMQFIGRFEMHPDEVLQGICKRMDIAAVSCERIEDEFEKLLLKSRCPSRGFRWLADLGRLHEILPELAHTQEIEQDFDWHPEGKVFEHLMQALDAASILARKDNLSSDDRLILLYAALCHDLGKISTTVVIEDRIKSPGHAEAGVPYTRSLLKRITRKVKIIDTVALLVKHHMQPSQFVQLHAKLAAYRRLALKLAKYTTLEMLARLALADRRGRNGNGPEPLEVTPKFLPTFLRNAEKARVLTRPEEAILHGRDISDLVSPGPEMGSLLKYAFELQLDKGINSKELLRKKVIEKLRAEKDVKKLPRGSD